MVQTQIGLGLMVNQDQTTEVQDNQSELLVQYLNIVFESYKPVETFDFESTVTMTTGELSEKIQAVCGLYFNESKVNDAMKQAGFVLKFISTIPNNAPDFYWLLKPKL